MSHRICLLVWLALCAIAAGRAGGDDNIAPIIERLDADQFADRRAAADELLRRGASAVPALEEAAAQASGEARERSLEILERLFHNGVDDARGSARAALERLSQLPGATGTRASEILRPAPEVPATTPRAPQVIFPNAPNANRINIRAGRAPRVIRTQVQVQDGVKRIEVQRDGMKFQMTEDPARGIEGEFTETKDGRETTEKFSAKDAAELKTKHPKAHEWYEKHVPNDRPGGRADEFRKEIYTSRLKAADEQLEQLKNDPALTPQERKLRLEVVERMRSHFDEQLQKLGK